MAAKIKSEQLEVQKRDVLWDACWQARYDLYFVEQLATYLYGIWKWVSVAASFIPPIAGGTVFVFALFWPERLGIIQGGGAVTFAIPLLAAILKVSERERNLLCFLCQIAGARRKYDQLILKMKGEYEFSLPTTEHELSILKVETNSLTLAWDPCNCSSLQKKAKRRVDELLGNN